VTHPVEVGACLGSEIGLADPHRPVAGFRLGPELADHPPPAVRELHSLAPNSLLPELRRIAATGSKPESLPEASCRVDSTVHTASR
jgi:hypothetical protein